MLEWLARFKKSIHVSFEVSLILKGINGLLELIGGSLLLFVPPERITQFLQLITYRELLQDPDDKIANYLLNIAHTLSLSSKLFAALFLLSHGIVKLFLIIALLKKKHWAYPITVIIFSIFTLYQVYRFILFGSLAMLFFVIVDLFVITLTWLEYTEILLEDKTKVVYSSR